LLPIFTAMTLDRLERQKEFFTQRLLEKGVSLIRTFEAGTRAGMFTMQWGARRIQAMLLETSIQPEVLYMMITSKDGRILAHSDASMVGEIFTAMPEAAKINENPALAYHRVREQTEDVEFFEVIKRFAPIRPEFIPRHMRRRGMLLKQHSTNRETMGWCRPYIQSPDGKMPEAAEHYIFAGLSMERERIARDRLLKTTILQGVFFFLLGCVGIVALFAFQAYRSARASLVNVKAFSDNVIQNMPAGLITINSDHKITSMNKTAKDILGRDLATPFPQMIELIKKIKTSHQILNREINLAVGNNLKIRLDITASPITDSENEITEFLFLFRDLTQIKELKKQVETNKRLAAIGKLAAGVAHEIRNPLSSIKGFVTYFAKRHEANASDKETAQIMVNEVERINRSVTQLLEFAKPIAVEKKQVNIKDMIVHSLKLVQNDLDQRRIDTKVNIDTNKSEIYTDNDRMNQVLLNLYINAMEAIDAKRTMDTMGTRKTLEVQVIDTAEDGQVEIKIRDNGIGIDKDSLDKIFDPYFTTKATGTGLGLSIVHRIVETLKGTIRVESTKGQGTCFIINLPVAYKNTNKDNK